MDRDSPSVLSFYIGESKMQKFERKSTKHLLFELDLRFGRHLNHFKTWGLDVISIILRHFNMISLGDYINFSKSLLNMHYIMIIVELSVHNPTYGSLMTLV